MPVLRCFVPAASKGPSGSAATFVLQLYYSSFGEQAFISWTIQNLRSEEIDVLPGIFPLERWSELTVRADKDNVTQQLRTTNKKAEPMKKVCEGDVAKKCVFLRKLLTACHLGPSAEIHQPKSNSDEVYTD